MAEQRIRAPGGQPREERSVEFSRIVAFSDGVFAIAITLLVLQLHIPEHLGSTHDVTRELLDQEGDFFAFGLSFAVIGRLWISHHRFFGEIADFDARLMALNLVYLAWMVLIPFSSEVLGDYADKTPAVVLYASNLTLVTVTGSLMSRYAKVATLASPEKEVLLRQGEFGGLFAAGVFLASIPIAFIAPSVAPLTWLLLFVDPTDRLAKRRGGAGVD